MAPPPAPNGAGGGFSVYTQAQRRRPRAMLQRRSLASSIVTIFSTTPPDMT